MCKLLFISKIDGLKVKENIKDIMKIMEVGNKDGAGIFSEKGFIKAQNSEDIFIEKSTKDNFDFLEFSGVLDEGDYLKGNSLAMHTRTSTNYLGSDYCHPFKINDSYFAHNGVVDIPKHNFPVNTRNDSEYLGHDLINNGFKSLKNVSGYYAFIKYDVADNVWTIGRDDLAQLYCGFIVENSSMIFATKESDIVAIAKILGVKTSFIRAVKDYSFIKISNNEIIEKGSLPKKINERKKDALYSKSIGNELEDDFSKFESKFVAENYDISDMFDQGYEDGLSDFEDDLFLEGFEGLGEDYRTGYMEAWNYRNDKTMKKAR